MLGVRLENRTIFLPVNHHLHVSVVQRGLAPMEPWVREVEKGRGMKSGGQFEALNSAIFVKEQQTTMRTLLPSHPPALCKCQAALNFTEKLTTPYIRKLCCSSDLSLKINAGAFRIQAFQPKRRALWVKDPTFSYLTTQICSLSGQSPACLILGLKFTSGVI